MAEETWDGMGRTDRSLPPDAMDSVTGQVLRGELVEVSRREEMENFLGGRFHGKDVYNKVPEEESWEGTGKPPIKVSWWTPTKEMTKN